MDVPSPAFYIYVLRCPVTDDIRYVGATRNPKARAASHRSRKSHASLLVDVWSDQLAKSGTPVVFEVVAVCDDIPGTGSLAVHLEESVIAYCRKAGYQLLNADVPALKRQKKRRPSYGNFCIEL